MPGEALLIEEAGGSRLAIFSGPDAIEVASGKPYGSDAIGYSNPTGGEVMGADLTSRDAVVVDRQSPHELLIGRDRLAELAVPARALAECKHGFPGEAIRTVQGAGEKAVPAIAGESADGLVLNYRGPSEPLASGLDVSGLPLGELRKAI